MDARNNCLSEFLATLNIGIPIGHYAIYALRVSEKGLRCAFFSGGPLCTTTFSKGLFGLVNEPAQPSKIENHSVETTSTEAALCSNYCLLRMRAHCFRHYLVLYRPKEGKGQGTAGWSATLQDFRQNTSFASKEYPNMGTEFGCKICILCAELNSRFDEAEIPAKFGL